MKYQLTESRKISLISKKSKWAVFVNCVIYGAIIAVPLLMLLLVYTNTFFKFPTAIFPEDVKQVLAYIGIFLTVSNLAYLIYMFFLIKCKYREVPTVADEDLPSCAVIIPAYNEGKHVLSSLNSILEADYPPHKLEIIAVDDGSTDDTWEYIARAAAESNGRIKALKQPCNMGKRFAIQAGVNASNGDIIVTIDSDSIIFGDALKRLVSPFVKNAKVGCVAGNVRVLNLDEGILPKMLEVSFLFSFEFVRAAQSAFKGVFCAPGALAAFRRSAVLSFIKEWAEEMFLGKPANIGEDRALTGRILKNNYDVVFQKNAIVYTLVPTTYKGLCKMLIRWERSNVRENFLMIPFVFNRFAFNSFKFISIQITLFMQLLWSIIPLFTAFLYIYCMIATLGYFFVIASPMAVAFAVLPAILYYHRCKNINAFLAYIYSLFYFTVLFWITPYSILSFHRSSWLTRGEKKQKLNNDGRV
ncbi:MAG: glycosyltransferase family 2 protein [Lentisphaeria bacterium]|nr:glycosyltransferase family 2 protein [Lentisphaeria bacterium]